MKKILSNKYIIYSLFATGGLLLGWLFFHTSSKVEDKSTQTVKEVKATIWTCSMHPQIRKDGPGKCPICGMDLIPLNQSPVDVDENSIHLSKEAIALANVQTSMVTKQKPLKEIRLYGKVQADERLLQSQVAHLPGRIEKLMVNFTGEGIQKGQTLAIIYSPELVTAQQELLESSKTKESQPEIYEAAKEKLRQWKLTESQIAKIESSGTVLNDFEVVSNTTGIVTAKRVNSGDHISSGTILFEIADLSKIWIMFDAYESDISFLNTGDLVSFAVQAIPGKNYSGKIIFIDPVIDPITRVSKVRVEIENQSGKLKPEMFVIGIVNANLSEYKDKMIIPSSAVLWTGKRSIVYIKQPNIEEPVFKIREIELGPNLGNSYVVINGLKEGEEIVTQGAFSVDAAAQLEGKPSMMNSDGGKSNTMPGMDIPVDSKSKKDESMSGMDMSSTSSEKTIQHTSFIVSGNCEMCKDRIEKAAKSVNGVSSAVWDDKTKQLEIDFNNSVTNLDEIQKTIAKIGHDTERYKASKETYDSLPECCKYRN
jgi:Cu(I)/Ag(I) efflux system membrane fusion protein